MHCHCLHSVAQPRTIARRRASAILPYAPRDPQGGECARGRVRARPSVCQPVPSGYLYRALLRLKVDESVAPLGEQPHMVDLSDL